MTPLKTLLAASLALGACAKAPDTHSDRPIPDISESAALEREIIAQELHRCILGLGGKLSITERLDIFANSEGEFGILLKESEGQTTIWTDGTRGKIDGLLDSQVTTYNDGSWDNTPITRKENITHNDNSKNMLTICLNKRDENHYNI